jgi:hypothetical protein
MDTRAHLLQLTGAEVIQSAERLSKALEQLQATPLFEQLEELEKHFDGQILIPSLAKRVLNTEARCGPFNQDMRGYPLVVAQPKNVADVVNVLILFVVMPVVSSSASAVEGTITDA